MARVPTGGDELTAAEETLIANLQAGTFNNVVPSGTVNGSNTTFTLAASPSPASSLDLRLNGAHQKSGGEDFTLTNNSIAFVVAPPTNSLLLASFLVDTDT